MKVQISKVIVNDIVFTDAASASAVLMAQPEVRFEVLVVWADKTEQKARIKGKTVSEWLSYWANAVISGPPDASEEDKKLFVSNMLLQNPRLVDHADRLLSDLSLS